MTKSTITRERLAKIKSWRETYGAGSNVMLPAEEAEELACLALAAMDGEPFAYIIQDKYERERGVEGHLSRSHVSKYVSQEDINEHEITCTPLYRHAQPAPVVPDEIKHRIGGLDWGWEGEFNRGWNACRAAMLQAEPVCTCPSGDGSLRWPCPVHPGNSPAIPDCWCRTCRPVVLNDMRFVVCPDCGNKRCPRANDHRNACTGSNEPGQEGSAYPDTPQEVKGE